MTNHSNIMSSTSSSLKGQNISKIDNDSSLISESNFMDCFCHRSDILDREKKIPNVFSTSKISQLDSILMPLSVLEREKDIPNIFNVNANSTYLSTVDTFFDYPNLFTFTESYPESSYMRRDFSEEYSDFTNVFSLSGIQNFICEQHLEIYNGENAKQEKSNLTLDHHLPHESSSKEILTGTNELEINNLNTTERCSTVKFKQEEQMSSPLCFWHIVTGINVRDHNIKTHFPQKEISSKCIMEDIKLMLINMGSTYFLVDDDTLMYKRNGNISIAELTPEMFESVTDSILECSNLHKTLRHHLIDWKNICNDSITEAFLFAVSNILDDYERTIYAIPDESLMSLVARLAYITPRLQLLFNISSLIKNDCSFTSEYRLSGIKLLNKIYDYLFNYRFARDLFLKTLLYLFQSCCTAYLRILSNWALRGDFNDMDTGMFIQLKPKIEDEEINIRRDWNRFIIDDSIEIPVFFEKYKIDILQCGKTINFFNRFNDLNVFLPEFAICFDAIDTQKMYDQFSVHFNYSPNLKIANSVKTMSNCYLFESIDGLEQSKENIDSNDTRNENVPKYSEITEMYLKNESHDFFQIPDWTTVNNEYNFNKAYGFFVDNNDPLTYNGKPVDIVNMVDYIPHSLLIPARIQKAVCDKLIMDMFFIQENLMSRLYYLSQCFFLINWRFSSKLCETLFNGIVANRQKPTNIFNSIKLKSIVEEAIQDSFSGNEPHNLTLEMSFVPYLNGFIDISDVECLELNYSPEWPMNMILSNKILVKYKRIFLFANKLEYVSWCLSKARELLSTFKNDTGLQFRKINVFKHSMNQFISSIQQYYKQVVISSCWSELNENFENAQNYDDLFTYHKQYMHKMLSRCLMIVGLKDKLILLNKIYIEILVYYQALASGQFYMRNSERLHSEFISMEQAFLRFTKLRETFYMSVLKTVQTQGKHYVQHLESLIIILGPSCDYT